MNPNDIPTPDLPLKGSAVPLNQPFPKELTNAPFVDIAEQVGQAALDKSVRKEKADKLAQEQIQAAGNIIQSAGSIAAESAGAKSKDIKSAEKKGDLAEQPNKTSPKKTDKKEELKDKASTVKDKLKDKAKSLKDTLKKATKEKDSKKSTSNPLVKTLVIIGVVAVSLGLIMAFFMNRFLGITLMFIGSIAITACVFLPIGVKK